MHAGARTEDATWQHSDHSVHRETTQHSTAQHTAAQHNSTSRVRITDALLGPLHPSTGARLQEERDAPVHYAVTPHLTKEHLASIESLIGTRLPPLLRAFLLTVSSGVRLEQEGSVCFDAFSASRSLVPETETLHAQSSRPFPLTNGLTLPINGALRCKCSSCRNGFVVSFGVCGTSV